MTDPGADDDRVLVLMIFTRKAWLDHTTVLLPSAEQHSAIVHESIVNYPEARTMSLHRINREIAEGNAIEHPGRFPDDEFQRIALGILNTNQMPLLLKSFYLERSGQR